VAQVHKPSELKIVTKDGELEISIKLDINVNINQSDIVVKADAVATKIKENKELEEKANWEIPDFGPSPKLKFGK
jgi:hypothetical protein